MSEFCLRIFLGILVFSVGFVGCSKEKEVGESIATDDITSTTSRTGAGYIEGFGPSLNQPRLPELVELYRKVQADTKYPEVRNHEVMMGYRATLVGAMLIEPTEETPVEAAKYAFQLLGYMKAIVSTKPEQIAEFEAMDSPRLSFSELRDLLYLNREMNKIDGGTEF